MHDDLNPVAFVEAVLFADANQASFVTERVSEIQVDLGGIPGDRHYGLLRAADARQHIYSRGTLIANRRQISIVSLEECHEIAQRMGLPEVRPEWLGANLLVSGFNHLTQLPAGTRLLFPDGTGLICEGENEPCIGPGKKIEAAYDETGLRHKFVPAAKNRRGIVCSVEREGLIKRGDMMRLIFRG